MHDDWLFWITRDGKDLVATLGGYFDESHRDGLFMVSGALFFPDRARRFERDWRKIFPNGFHAREFNAPCVGSMLRAQQRSLLKATEAIVKHVAYIGAVGCMTNDAEAAFGNGDSQGKAYLGCGALAAMPLAGYARAMNRPEHIAYVYDRRDGGSAKALKEFFELIGASDEMREHYRVASQTQGSAKDCPLLQAADYLVWEFRNFQGRRHLPKYERYRENWHEMVTGLVSKAGKRHPAFYYHMSDLETLQGFADWLRRLRSQPDLPPGLDLST